MRLIAGGAAVVFALTGGWIFYNTNILDDYQTARSRLQARADYERRYDAELRARWAAAGASHPSSRKESARSWLTVTITVMLSPPKVIVPTSWKLVAPLRVTSDRSVVSPPARGCQLQSSPAASTNEVTTTFCKSPTRGLTPVAYPAPRRLRPFRGAKSIPINCLTPSYVISIRP